MFHFATHRVLDYPEYRFEIDEYQEPSVMLVHLRIWKFSPSILKRILSEFSAFRYVATFPLYALGNPDDAKWVRFISLLGFKPSGKHKSLFIHRVPD
jgi:hypothetical protein